MPKKNHTKNTRSGQDYISPNAAWWFTWYIDNIMAYVLVTKTICLLHPCVVNPSSVGAGRLMKVLCRMTCGLAVTAVGSNEALNQIVTIDHFHICWHPYGGLLRASGCITRLILDCFADCMLPSSDYTDRQGSSARLFQGLYVFGNKSQNLLIHALYTRIVLFWHISDMPPQIW